MRNRAFSDQIGRIGAEGIDRRAEVPPCPALVSVIEMPPFRFVEGESNVAHHVVQQAAVLADGFIHAGLFKGVGIGNRRKFIKRRAHVQRRSVPAQRQIHCPARLMGRRAQLIFAGFCYKLVPDLVQIMALSMRMLRFL